VDDVAWARSLAVRANISRATSTKGKDFLRRVRIDTTPPKVSKASAGRRVKQFCVLSVSQKIRGGNDTNKCREMQSKSAIHAPNRKLQQKQPLTTKQTGYARP
jgi:hypothetical protein